MGLHMDATEWKRTHGMTANRKQMVTNLICAKQLSTVEL